jgi:hypothetical protein
VTVLAHALRSHVEAFAAVEALELPEIDPAEPFDPRWDV